MKTRIFFLLLFIPTIFFSQNILILKNGKMKNNGKPVGRNVTLTYDKFFKSYNVSYTNIDGYRNEMKFIWEPGHGSTILSKLEGILIYEKREYQILIDKDVFQFPRVRFEEKNKNKYYNYMIYDFTAVNLSNYKK